jgi:uncharacterized Zn finger protein
MVDQSGPFDLSEPQLAQAVEEKTFHRAQPYVREFTHRLRSGHTIGGRVVGPYSVYSVSLQIEGGSLRPSCSCTTEATFCKHVVALGLTYLEEPHTFYDLQTLTAELEQFPPHKLISLIVQIATRHPQILSMLGVEGFPQEEDEDDEEEEDDDEPYDDDDFEDDDELDDEDEEFEDEEEELAGGLDVEAIYEEADSLLDEFQEDLKSRGIAREDRARYDEVLQVFVDDYLAAYAVGKLTDMNRDEIDTYLRDFLVERERMPKRRLADTKQAFAFFYTFLCDRGHISSEKAAPIIHYCQR